MPDLQARATNLIFASVAAVLLTVVAFLLHKSSGPAGVSAQASSSNGFTLSSKDFSNGGEIPKEFTCDGADLSPELTWASSPRDTQSFALIADDPDAPAGTWTHWVLYDLPANISQLPRGVSKADELANGAHQGRNDFQRVGYNGPCPPPGKEHRYFFKLYALNSRWGLRADVTKQDLERAMEGHILAKTELMGKYQR
jgi:Raf kinase inhibitor-like YbhB/YbcL family protein